MPDKKDSKKGNVHFATEVTKVDYEIEEEHNLTPLPASRTKASNPQVNNFQSLKTSLIEAVEEDDLDKAKKVLDQDKKSGDRKLGALVLVNYASQAHNEDEAIKFLKNAGVNFNYQALKDNDSLLQGIIKMKGPSRGIDEEVSIENPHLGSCEKNLNTLIAQGANVLAQNRYNETALHTAVQENHQLALDVVCKALSDVAKIPHLNAQVKELIETKDYTGKTAMDCASEKGNIEMILQLHTLQDVVKALAPKEEKKGTKRPISELGLEESNAEKILSERTNNQSKIPRR